MQNTQNIILQNACTQNNHCLRLFCEMRIFINQLPPLFIKIEQESRLYELKATYLFPHNE